MRFPLILLRWWLALALVVGGLPATAMAGPSQDKPAVAATCHDVDAPVTAAERESPASGCCGSMDCQCDCLEHMPVVALGLPLLVTPLFAGKAQGSRALDRHNWCPSASLRPPIA